MSHGPEPSPNSTLESLYRIRDELETVVSRLDAQPPADVVDSLSVYRTACLTILEHHTAFVHKLAVQTERADSNNPSVLLAVEELRSISNEMAQCALHAEQSLQTHEDLRRGKGDHT